MSNSKIEIGHYNDGKGIIPDNCIKISPSKIIDFLETTHTWFRELIMNEDGFTGNSGSCIGNIIHYGAECTAKKEPIVELDIAEYIGQLVPKLDQPDPRKNLDPSIVDSAYGDMLPLIVDYVETNMPESTEGYVWSKVTPRVVLAGSYDAIRKNPMSGKYIVIDYKSTAEKLPPKKIEFKHKLQGYCYAWALKKQKGIEVDAIEIVYVTRYHPGAVGKTGKIGRDYQPTITPLQISFDQSNFEFIDQLIHLIAETMEHFLDNPKQAYMLFKDYRLKNKDFARFIKEYKLEAGDYDDF